MAELDDKLRQLLSDQDSMRQIMEAASALMNGSAPAAGGTAPSEATAQAVVPAAAPSNPPPEGLADMVSSVLSQMNINPSAQGDDPGPPPSTMDIKAMLPGIIQAMGGGGRQIRPEKLNLVKAVQPYMQQGRGANVDRAINMATVAMAAKAILEKNREK